MTALEIFALVIVGFIILFIVKLYHNDSKQKIEKIYEQEFINHYLKGK